MADFIVKAPPAACSMSETEWAFNQHCYCHSANGGHSSCLSSRLSMSVLFSIQDEATDIIRSAPQGGSLPCWGYLLGSFTRNKEGSKGIMVLLVKSIERRFPTNSLYVQMDNAPLHSITSMYQPWVICLLF